MSDDEVRLECLRMARGDIRHARELYDFVMQRLDKTPKERIEDAIAELERGDATKGQPCAPAGVG